MTDASADGKKKGHGAGSRDRRLMALPHWDDVEVRLRYRCTPREVEAWHKRTWPNEAAPDWRTLYRFLKGKPETWFVERLLLDQSGTRRVSRILVIREQAELIEMQKMRLRRGEQVEGAMSGVYYPEHRVNIETYNRLLESQQKLLQEAGIEPKVTSERRGDEPPPRPLAPPDLSTWPLEKILLCKAMLAELRGGPGVIDGEAVRVDGPNGSGQPGAPAVRPKIAAASSEVKSLEGAD